MKSPSVTVAFAALALLTGAGSAAAQDIGISVSWGSSNVRASGYYVSDGLRVVGRVRDVRYARRAPRRIERRHYAECVREDPYLYCWDAPRYHRVRPIVYVYVTDRDMARRHHRGRGWDRSERYHQRFAARSWRRWADDHRYRYDRDRLIVDVAFAW